MFLIKKDDATLFSCYHGAQDEGPSTQSPRGSRDGGWGWSFGSCRSTPPPHHQMISNEHPDPRGKASAVKHDLGKYRHARWTPPRSGFPFGRWVVFLEDTQCGPLLVVPAIIGAAEQGEQVPTLRRTWDCHSSVLMQCSQGWARTGWVKCGGHCALMHQLPVSGKSEKHTFLISLASGEQTGQLVFTDQIWMLKWAGLARWAPAGGAHGGGRHSSAVSPSSPGLSSEPRSVVFR